jgi:hypothetical protein
MCVGIASCSLCIHVEGVSCHASALMIKRLRGQESCLVSEHTNSKVTAIAHSCSICRPSPKHHCPRETPVGQDVGRT